MTNAIAKDYIADGIRCNSVSPARVHTPFVDDYIEKNYPGKEKKRLIIFLKPSPSEEWQNHKKSQIWLIPL